ncbi:MAG: prephenate dehydratase [Thiohalomonadales bacterium]
MSETTSLDQLRGQIDALDTQIQTLINQRGQLAQQVAKTKETAGDNTTLYYRAEREAQILRKIVEGNAGPIPGVEMAQIFREIMSSCLALEQRLQVAYLGPQGTYTQSAAIKHFGQAVNTLPAASIADVFHQVESDAVHFGVVPVENSTEGAIDMTLDLFMKSNVTICGEVELRVRHNLLSKEKELTGIKRLFSHQQSFAQCKQWTNANLAGVECIAVSSNAEAARRASVEKHTAAIAGEKAAEIYDLHELVKNIEDDTDNTTRFNIIGKSVVTRSGKDKTSILATTNDTPGALFRLLQPLQQNAISMSRIESRPSKLSTWAYVFFIDIEGHQDDTNVASALATLKEEAAMLKVLGSYPKAVIRES